MATKFTLQPEDAASAPGAWTFENDVQGFTGSGYAFWDDNYGRAAQAGNGIIRFTINVTDPGNYFISARGARADDSRLERKDEGNDFYIRVNGQDGFGDNDWAKFFLFFGDSSPDGDPGVFEQWRWRARIEENQFTNGSPLEKKDAVFFLGAGQNVIEISGRSGGFLLDALVVNKGSVSTTIGGSGGDTGGGGGTGGGGTGGGGTGGGGTGGSVIDAGASKQTYNFGAGNFTYVADAASDSTRAAVDLIQNFGPGDDLDLRGLDYDRIVFTVGEYNADASSLLVRQIDSNVVLNFGRWASTSFQLRVQGDVDDVLAALGAAGSGGGGAGGGGSTVTATAAAEIFDAGGGAKTFVFPTRSSSPASNNDDILNFGADDTIDLRGLNLVGVELDRNDLDAGEVLVRQVAPNKTYLNVDGWGPNDMFIDVRASIDVVLDNLLV